MNKEDELTALKTLPFGDSRRRHSMASDCTLYPAKVPARLPSSFVIRNKAPLQQIDKTQAENPIQPNYNSIELRWFDYPLMRT